MTKTDTDVWLTTSHASRVMGCSEATTRAKADRGEIPCVRTSKGVRLFRLEDAMRHANERAARQRSDHERGVIVDGEPRPAASVPRVAVVTPRDAAAADAEAWRTRHP